MTAVHVIIEGQVQGVGFRAWVEREAKARGLSGWVRNRADRSVEAVFAGAEPHVRAMVEACHRGPRLSFVRSVRTAVHPDENWTEFVIREME